MPGANAEVSWATAKMFVRKTCRIRAHSREQPLDLMLVRQIGRQGDDLRSRVTEQQNAGGIRRDDPVQMARFVWAVVHGTAMLVSWAVRSQV
jgi:hypothetical protein